ncbi:MAG: hypothetical protein RI885_2791 [Actinomycetota bacterium]|jgi:RNA polymerase sigma-70 factor (ECF subfamily)
MIDLLPRTSLANADDRTLAGRAADGDLRAFEVILRRHGPLMRAYATRVLGSNDETDDVVQEAFIVAWRQLPNLENTVALKSWLLRIVTNKSIDRVRARRHHADIDELEFERPDGETAATAMEATSLDEALSAALSTLPEDQRRCWMLREIAGYSYDDIAEQLGLPHSTIRGILARARKSLVIQMEGWR